MISVTDEVGANYQQKLQHSGFFCLALTIKKLHWSTVIQRRKVWSFALWFVGSRFSLEGIFKRAHWHKCVKALVTFLFWNPILPYAGSTVTGKEIKWNPLTTAVTHCIKGAIKAHFDNVVCMHFPPRTKLYVLRLMDGPGANITHKEAKQRSQCQTHWSVCAREEIFRGLKTVAAFGVHIHHRGDCCVCPEEGLVCVSRLQSYQPWWLVASPET